MSSQNIDTTCVFVRDGVELEVNYVSFEFQGTRSPPLVKIWFKDGHGCLTVSQLESGIKAGTISVSSN